MTYFTAVVAADSGSWRALDVDVEDASDLDDLADEARSAAQGPVLVVLEREDEWFALLRADGREPRLFVSDLPAVQGSRYAELLATAADSPASADGAARPAGEAEDEDGDDVDDQAVARDDEDDEGEDVAAPTWAGDPGVLVDLGVDADSLAEIAEGHDPATALAELGERCGFVDLLEALR